MDMTYYDYINALFELLQVNPIPPNTQLLYHVLLMIFNKAHWAKELQRTNSSLCGLCGFNEKALIKAKNELKQLGLIDFKSKKKQSTTYILTVKSTVKNAVKNAVKTEVKTEVKSQVKRQSKVQSIKDIRLKSEDVIHTPSNPPQGGSAPKNRRVHREHGAERGFVRV